MTLSWQKNKGRRLGLPREELPYGHLLVEPCKSPEEELGREEDSDDAIFAPPERGSSKSSSPVSDGAPSEPDFPPASKRRKVEPASSQSVDLVSPSSKKQTRSSTGRSQVQPSNIQPTQFTARSSQASQASKTDDEDVFPDYTLSQNRLSQTKRKTYRSKKASNFHKAPPAKVEKSNSKEEHAKAEPVVQTSAAGFKTDSLHDKPDRTNGFKPPPKLSPSPRSERASRRSANESDTPPRPKRSIDFKRPLQPPSSKHKQPSPPSFIVPPGVPAEEPRRSSRSKPSSQEPPVFRKPNIQNIRDMADNVQNKLKVHIDAFDSSATASSGPSFDSPEFDIEDDGSSSSLSSAPDVQGIDTLDDHWHKTHTPSSPKVKCPLCGFSVSRFFLEERSTSGNLSTRQQAVFCKAHKIRSAEQTWRSNGYPEIDWQQFTGRLPQYEDAMAGILNGTRRSFYRNVFEEQIKSGNNRTLQQSLMSGSGWEGLNVGYYGTKGARILYDL
ncbi:MAG: hypothetical protein Q9183_004596 [Haloplaca sp. 2 TL-2023]